MNAKAELSAQAINILDAEHRNIEVILETLECLEKGEADWGIYERAIALLEEYADSYHHIKEEDLLFPAMIEAGIPKSNSPVSCMEEEHKLARSYVQKMRGHLSEMDATGMRETASRYCNLLREHIAKEDNILYPMALQMIQPDGWRKLAQSFIEVEDRLGSDEEFVRRALSLRRRAHKA
jgi:hemerythrin-like domain-containing protein